MKNILVTGSVGFIGSNLLKRPLAVGERCKECKHINNKNGY